MLKEKEIPSYTLRPLAIGRGFRVGFRRGLACDGLFVWRYSGKRRPRVQLGKFIKFKYSVRVAPTLAKVLKGFSFK